MKPILLLLACLLPFVTVGQEAVCTPFDNNGDNIVGIGDLIDLLARFGDSDLDEDGIWDSADDCIGTYDTCGVCNGPGPTALAIDEVILYFDSVFLPPLDEWYVYQVGADTILTYVCENIGCTDQSALNYDPYAEQGGYCEYASCSSLTYNNYTYDLILAGSKCWFAEDLKSELYCNGDSICPGCSNPSTFIELSQNFTSGNAAFINGEEISSTWIPGTVAYNWYAVASDSICPTGWRVSTDNDWIELSLTFGASLADFENGNEVIGQDVELGTQLKSDQTWTDYDWDVCSGSNVIGFDGQAVGFYNYYGIYGVNEQVIYWTLNTEDDSHVLYALYCDEFLLRDNDLYLTDTQNGNSAFTVRCVTDWSP